MKIQILDVETCEKCVSRNCSFLNVAKVCTGFNNMKSETTVCPTLAIGDRGPVGLVGSDGYISAEECVSCGLCVVYCNKANLICADHDSDTSEFGELTELQLKAVVSQYLMCLFEFAANTNRNRAMLFDGYMTDRFGEQAFVEIDYNNDSLKCTRRLLGDIMMFSGSRNIRNGLLVLSELPSAGNRDVYALIEKMRAFPTTSHINVFMTTLSHLREMALFLTPGEYGMNDLFYDCTSESVEEYKNRIAVLVFFYSNLR